MPTDFVTGVSGAGAAVPLVLIVEMMIGYAWSRRGDRRHW
jgi:hypothetical protein